MDGLDDFIAFCHAEQPKDPVCLEMYFSGLAVFPLEGEALLQAYLFFYASELFPGVRDLLLYERPPDKEGHQNKGKVDFVYLTDEDRILIIETKYFLPKFHSQNDEVARRKGSTKRRKKNGDRNKVIKQALENRDLICREWGVPVGSVDCAVLTNDPHMEERALAKGVGNAYVRTHSLEAWRREMVTKLKASAGPTPASSPAAWPAPPIP